MPPFNLTSLTESLNNTYSQDLGNLSFYLNQCLQSTSTSVSNNCAYIVNLYNSLPNTTAYDFYAPTAGLSLQPQGSSQLLSAQQNTIALQYAGALSMSNSNGYSNVPVAALWLNTIPDNVLLGNLDYSSLMMFAYQPWIHNGSGTPEATAWAVWVGLPDQNMTSIYNYSNEFAWYTPAQPTNYYESYYPPNTIYYNNGCNTFAYTLVSPPCGISMTSNQYQTGGYLSPISNLFGTLVMP